MPLMSEGAMNDSGYGGAMGEWCAHTCEICREVTLQWVEWRNWQGMQRYFCDNDCLAQWIERMREDIAREIALECRHLCSSTLYGGQTP